MLFLMFAWHWHNAYLFGLIRSDERPIRPFLQGVFERTFKRERIWTREQPVWPRTHLRARRQLHRGMAPSSGGQRVRLRLFWGFHGFLMDSCSQRCNETWEALIAAMAPWLRSTLLVICLEPSAYRLVLARTPRRLALTTGAALAMNGALLASAS